MGAGRALSFVLHDDVKTERAKSGRFSALERGAESDAACGPRLTSSASTVA